MCIYRSCKWSAKLQTPKGVNLSKRNALFVVLLLFPWLSYVTMLHICTLISYSKNLWVSDFSMLRRRCLFPWWGQKNIVWTSNTDTTVTINIVSAHGPLAERLGTQNWKHFGSFVVFIWLVTGFLWDQCVAFFTSPPGNKTIMTPNPLIEEIRQVYNRFGCAKLP